MTKPMIIVHGGAGDPVEYVDGCESACSRGFDIMKRGGSALDAVVAAIVAMEDDERFNAGTGSEMKLDGEITMDAAVMSSDGRCGAVGAISFVKNPVLVARKVMENTTFIFLVGNGAVRFARKCGFDRYDPSTEHRRKELEEIKKRMKKDRGKEYKWLMENYPEMFHGTVGTVARDGKGRFATAVSSGGMHIVMPGRVGDSPIIGAGLFAGPKGAVCATGVGEEIWRRVLSKDIYDRIACGMSTKKACDEFMSAFPKNVPIGILAISKSGHAVVYDKLIAYAVL